MDRPADVRGQRRPSSWEGGDIIAADLPYRAVMWTPTSGTDWSDNDVTVLGDVAVDANGLPGVPIDSEADFYVVGTIANAIDASGDVAVGELDFVRDDQTLNAMARATHSTPAR